MKRDTERWGQLEGGHRYIMTYINVQEWNQINSELHLKLNQETFADYG